MKKTTYTFFLFFIFIATVSTQNITSTFRGTIKDSKNQQPLSGATIHILRIESSSGGVTNSLGHFKIENVPVGRFEVEVNFLGYNTLVLSEVLIEAGKEQVMEIYLDESSSDLQEIVVKANSTNNSISPLSNHLITIEEVRRFPATFFDPARLAMLYPGVTGTNDQANGLSIRGLPPSLLQWRLEGVEIVNPNHLSNAGTISDQPSVAAGGVNILSAQMLDNSRLFTGAFPVEYSNALGGIMDMRLRKGNNEQHEFTAQAGLLGFDLGMEGPFSKNSKASFLFNYRYSFTGLLTNFGVDFDGESIGFEDVSFNLNFPTKNAGNFMVFGIGGRSDNFKAALLKEEWEVAKDRQQIDYRSSMGILGATHRLALSQKILWKNVLAFSTFKNSNEKFRPAQINPFKQYAENQEKKVSGTSQLAIKINKRVDLETGIQFRHLSLNDSVNFSSIRFRKGRTLFLTPFAKFVFKPFQKFQFDIGANFNYLENHRDSGISSEEATTVTKSVDVRSGFIWTPLPRHKLSYSVGQYTRNFYLENIILVRNTENLWELSAFKFSKALQQSLKYEMPVFLGTKMSIEVYYQTIDKVPFLEVQQDPGSHLTRQLTSQVNVDEISFLTRDVQVRNFNSKSKNYGVELMLQRNILENWYFLFSGTIYESKYLDINGKYQDARFGGKWGTDLTIGKEYLKPFKDKTKILGLNIRVNYRGGFRERNLVGLSNNDALLFSDNFEKQLPNYFRVDVRAYIKWNKLGKTATLSLDLQNATSYKNVAYTNYNSLGQEIIQYQLGLIPLLNYRIEF